MEQAFYRDRLASHGLTVLVPDRQDRAAVHAIIYDELCQGIVLDSSRDRYREVIARLTAAGAEGVILGCTEIELLVTQADSPTGSGSDQTPSPHFTARGTRGTFGRRSGRRQVMMWQTRSGGQCSGSRVLARSASCRSSPRSCWSSRMRRSRSAA
jgi:hypothetical protein